MNQKDLLSIACVLMLALIGFAVMTQNVWPPPPLPAQRQLNFPHLVASQLPSAGVRGRVVIVTDSTSEKKCTKGGGNVAILCIDTGGEWKRLVMEGEIEP